MELDKILLSETEQSQSIQMVDGWFAVLNTPQGHKFLDDIAQNLCKAQCIKLLEWLKQKCTRHKAKRQRLGVFVSMRRWECPYCDDELQKALRG